MKLTRHFVDNWKLRVSNGVEPIPETVRSVMAGAIRLQEGRVFTLVNGGKYKTLSLFWNPELKIVVHTDPETGHAVTVSTDNMADGKDKTRKQRAKGEVVPGYVKMTMHGIGG